MQLLHKALKVNTYWYERNCKFQRVEIRLKTDKPILQQLLQKLQFPFRFYKSDILVLKWSNLFQFMVSRRIAYNVSL